MLGFICIHYTHSLKHLFSSVYSVPIRQVHWTQSQLIVQCNYNCLSVVNHYNLDIFLFSYCPNVSHTCLWLQVLGRGGGAGGLKASGLGGLLLFAAIVFTL